MKNPSNPKERNLLKGAVRRVFSRSEVRRLAIKRVSIQHFDIDRPRVKKWSKCPNCNKETPEYLMQADHIEPIIPVNSTLEDMTWDEIVDRVWMGTLQPLCKPCHAVKTKAEQKLRREYKKGMKNE